MQKGPGSDVLGSRGGSFLLSQEGFPSPEAQGPFLPGFSSPSPPCAGDPPGCCPYTLCPLLPCADGPEGLHVPRGLPDKLLPLAGHHGADRHHCHLHRGRQGVLYPGECGAQGLALRWARTVVVTPGFSLGIQEFAQDRKQFLPPWVLYFSCTTELERFLSALNAAWRNIYQVSVRGCHTLPTAAGQVGPVCSEEGVGEFFPAYRQSKPSLPARDRRTTKLCLCNHGMWDLEQGKCWRPPTSQAMSMQH